MFFFVCSLLFFSTWYQSPRFLQILGLLRHRGWALCNFIFAPPVTVSATPSSVLPNHFTNLRASRICNFIFANLPFRTNLQLHLRVKYSRIVSSSSRIVHLVSRICNSIFASRLLSANFFFLLRKSTVREIYCPRNPSSIAILPESRFSHFGDSYHFGDSPAFHGSTLPNFCFPSIS